MKAAELVGVSRPMWSSWECRARQMTIAQLNRIQERLTPPLTDSEVEKIRKWWTRPPKKKRKAKVEADPLPAETAGKKEGRTTKKGSQGKTVAA